MLLKFKCINNSIKNKFDIADWSRYLQEGAIYEGYFTKTYSTERT